MASHENTHTFTIYQLVTIIFLVAVISLIVFVYSPQLSSGMTEMDAQLKCKELGQIREDINRIELSKWIVGVQTTGHTLTELPLLQLPPGCGVMYTQPCNSTTNCQTEIRKSLTRCWDNIQTEKTTTGTCLLNLEINKTFNGIPFAGSQLGLAQVCASATKYCGDDTQVPKDSLDYSSEPQGGDSISMEYGLGWWGWGSSKIWVKCQGKCKS